MTEELYRIWIYLAASPLLGLTATLIAYQAGQWLFAKSRGNPLVNPVLIAVTMIGGFLWLTDTPYQSYFDGAQFVHFLLGPAVVALAVPLYRQVQALKRSALALGVGLVTGSAFSVLAAVGLGRLFGASQQTLMSLAPKSATSPIAMGVAEKLGGLPSLTAALVILTGITGAIAGHWVLDLVRVRDPMARGFAIGLAAHGIGTARAMQLSEVAGAFAGLAMGLNGIATAVLVPLLVSLM